MSISNKIDGESLFFSNEKEDRTIIYHYTNKKIAINKILGKNNFLFSQNKNFNDPKENKIWFNSRDDNQHFEWNDFFRKFQENIQIASFTKDNLYEKNKYINSIGVLYPGRGFNHPRMWAQYADNHHGVCLAFDKNKIENELIRNNSIFQYYCGEIEYVPSLFYKIEDEKIYNSYFFDTKDKLKSNIDLILEKTEKGRIPFFFRKMLDWKEENEYRFVIIKNNSSRLSINILDNLVAIILGWSFPESQYKKVIKLGEKYKVHVYKMEYHNGNAHLPEIIL